MQEAEVPVYTPAQVHVVDAPLAGKAGVVVVPAEQKVYEPYEVSASAKVLTAVPQAAFLE